MEYAQRRSAAPFARYCLCALATVLLSACGADGTSSTSGTQNDTAPDTPAAVASPTIAGTPDTTVVAGTKYVFQPSASDTTGDTLTFSIQHMPAWAIFDSKSGSLSGTPAPGDVGSYAGITITAADGTATAQLPAFTIQVTAAATVATPTSSPPTITGTPATSVLAGAHYQFQPSPGNVNGATLTYAITNKPSWANFIAATGQLSGTPSVANVGTYPDIGISVSDGTYTVGLQAFSIQVTAPPVSPPTISGTPVTQAQAGTPYSFTPAAQDPAGKTLSFSIQNKPNWAMFTASNGQLSGTPASSDVGNDPNIIITVSNGSASAALAAFTIVVAAAPPPPPPTTGTATVKWVAPTLNTDGSPVSLSGYVISYGNSATALSQTIPVNNPSTTSYTIQNLGQGTWYFAVSAVATDGSTSSLSLPASKVIQ